MPRRFPIRTLLFTTAAAFPLLVHAAATAPVSAEGQSSFHYSVKDDIITVETVNQGFEITGDRLPGRPDDERLVLRTTMRQKETVGDIGVEGEVTIEAWTLGHSLAEPPVYQIKVEGVSARQENEMLIVERGTEETQWESVYNLGTGKPLFDTTVTPTFLGWSADGQTWNYRVAGFYPQTDDATNPRLKRPGVVGLLSYASSERVIRQVLVTHDDPKQAQLYASLADTSTRLVADPAPGNPGKRPVHLFLSFTGAAKGTIDVSVLKDDLDFAHAKLPHGMHLTTY